MASLFRYMGRRKGRFVLGMAFLAGSSAAPLAFPWLAGKLLDAATGHAPPGSPSGALILGLMAVAILLTAVFSFFRLFLFAQVAEGAMAALRTDLFARMVRLPVATLEKNRSGELASRLSADVAQLQDSFSSSLAELVRVVLTLLTASVVILFLSGRLTLFMLAVFPVAVLTALAFGRLIRARSRQAQDALAGTAALAEETLIAAREVKAFGMEAARESLYRGRVFDAAQTAVRAALGRGAFVSFFIFAIFGAIVAVMAYGMHLVARGVLSTGDLTAFVIYTAFLGGSLAGLGDLWANLQKSLGASTRIRELLEERTEDAEGSPQSHRFRPDGGFSFDAIDFRYPSRPTVEVLKKLSFTVRAGERVALVGASGSGKSTIAGLLLRFYEPDKGEIRFTLADGSRMPGSLLAPGDVRRHIGWVPQDIVLLGGSIAENLRVARPEASDAELRAALEKANALEFVERLPAGLDTAVGERGQQLSGGQKQRLAIARAFLKDPPILLLDEATSSLDAQSEQTVQKALDLLMKGRTTLVIAHRLSTVRTCDRILVLRAGELIESGTHDELIDRGGLYRHLVELQFGEA